VNYTDAALLLKEKGRRAFEILDDFESDLVPEGIISIDPPDERPG